MKKIHGAKLIQPLMAAGVFLLLSVMYFLPQLQGKVLQQSDIISVRGMNQEAVEWRDKTGRIMLWTNSMFGGMPTYQMSVPQKNNLVKYVYDAHQAFISRPIGYYFAAMLGCYIVLACLGAGHWPAMLGAVAFGLTTNQMTLFETGHMTKFMTIVFSAYVFGGAILAYQKKYLAGGILFALGMGLSLFANHIQMTYYMGMFLVLYVPIALIISMKKKDLPSFFKASAVLLAGLILSVGASASKLWTTKEFSEETMRGKPILEKPISSAESSSTVEGLAWDYAMQWSNGPKDLIAMFIPRGAGGSGSEDLGSNAKVIKDLRSKGFTQDISVPLYFGSLPFTAGPAYIGASVMFLFVFGLFYMRPSIRWWLLGIVILSILMSMGKHFALLNKPLFDLMPLYSKFRAPSSILSLTALLIPLGAALGLGGFMKGHEKSFMKPIWIALGSVGGLCLLAALLGPSLMSFNGNSDARLAEQGWNIDALIADRKSALVADAWRSFIWVALSAAVIWTYHQGKIKQWLLLSGLGLFIIADLWAVGRRYIAPADFVPERAVEAIFDERPVDKQIKQDTDLHFRVHDITGDPFNSSYASYHHKTIGGYSPVKLQRAQDLIDRYIARGNMNVLNALNMKYIILNGQNKQPVVQSNPQAMGNAWFVDSIVIVNSNNEELDAIDSVNLAYTAFVHKDFAGDVQGLDPVKNGTIKLTSYIPDEMVYQSSSTSDQLAVFSEMYYGPDKGWQAYIDGKEVPHFRADYAFRAIKVPSGDHEIRFTFHPKSYYAGENFSLIASLLIVAALIFGLYRWLITEIPVAPVVVAEIAGGKSFHGSKKNQPRKKNK